MKTKISRAIYAAVIVYSYVIAQAQAGYLDNAIVDVSVHAGVEEQAERPPEGGAKQPAALSSWSFQPARGQSAEKNASSSFSSFLPLTPVPTVSPARPMINTVADPPAKRRFNTPIEIPNYLRVLPPKYDYGTATQQPTLTAPVSQGSRLHRDQVFPNLFDQNLLGTSSDYPLSKTTYPVASVWRHKPRATKSSAVSSKTVPVDPLAKPKR